MDEQYCSSGGGFGYSLAPERIGPITVALDAGGNNVADKPSSAYLDARVTARKQESRTALNKQEETSGGCLPVRSISAPEKHQRDFAQPPKTEATAGESAAPVQIADK